VDGKPDLAVANFLSDDVSVLLGGGGSFTGPFTFDVGSRPNSIAVGDFNADGRPDLATANANSNDATVLINGCAAPPITLSPSTLPGGTAGTPYSQTLSASGGTAPYTFAVTAGTLPPGLTLSTGGVLSGTPSAAGTFNFTGRAADADNRTGSRAYTLTVSCPTVIVNPNTLPKGAVGVAYNQTLTASGGAASYTFAVTTGTLPTGLTLNPNGTLSGTPSATGDFNFTVQATDANNCKGSRAYTVTIISCPAITVNPSALPNGGVGQPYPNTTLSASGGAAPYTFAVTSGALPAGLTLSISGVLSGTPTAGGTFNFTVTATDANSCKGSRSYTLVINRPPTITGTTLSRQQGAAGTTSTIATVSDAEDAAGSLTVTVTSLPAGITVTGITNTNGTITANVAASCNAALGNNTVGLKVTDGGGLTATASLTVNVTASSPPTITLKPSLSAFPNNHKYTTITLSQMVQSATDDCDGDLLGSVVIERVTSDEADNAPGNSDGNTVNDIVIAPDCKSVQLRAERDDNKNGRVYVVTLRVRDSSGNTVRAQYKVTVPLSQNGNPAVQDATAFTVTSSCP